MKPVTFEVTEEDLQAALFGFQVAKQQLTLREIRFRSLLENGAGPMPVKKSHHAQLTNGDGTPKPTLPADAIPADQAHLYLRNPDGSFKLTKTGKPRRAGEWTPERRKEQADRIKARYAAGVGPTPSGQPSGYKMAHHPDGSEAYFKNADGSIRLTAAGKPWKRISATVARKNAGKSHAARGLS